MTHTQFSTKVLEVKLKTGATSNDIAETLGCSVESLDFTIRSHLSDKAADKYIRRIRQNDKAAKRLTRGKKPETISDNYHLVDDFSADDTLVVEAQVDDTQVDETQVDSLPELEKHIEALKETLNSKELLHRDVEDERHTIRCELQSHKETLTKILEQVTSEECSILSLQKRIEETSQEMLQLNGEINHIRDEIAETEKKISELKKVSVLVFDNGSVETSVVVPENWADLFAKLVADESLGDFRMNQLRALAKAKILQEAYPELTFEFVFETQELEQFLHQKEE